MCIRDSNNALKTCPKCGHKFYDIPDKDKEKTKSIKEPFFKSGNGQGTIHDKKDVKK